VGAPANAAESADSVGSETHPFLIK
jgi:hypothetical protein